MSVVAPTKCSSDSSLRREKSVSRSHAYLGRLPGLRRQLQHQGPGAPRLQLPWSIAVVHRLQDDSPPPPAGEQDEKREGKEVPPSGTHSGTIPQILLAVTWSRGQTSPLRVDLGSLVSLGRPAALLFTLWSSPQSLPPLCLCLGFGFRLYICWRAREADGTSPRGGERRAVSVSAHPYGPEPGTGSELSTSCRVSGCP